MRIIIEMDEADLTEALTAYLAPRGMKYVSHSVVDEGALQIVAEPGAPPVPVPAPAAPSIPSRSVQVVDHVAGASTTSNPRLSLTDLHSADSAGGTPITEQGGEADVDELRAVLASMSELPETPEGVRPAKDRR